MRANGITPERLAKEAAMDLPALKRIIAEKDRDVRIMTAMRIRDACGRLVTRQIGIAEVFDVGQPVKRA
jgi:hypothetical protein